MTERLAAPTFVAERKKHVVLTLDIFILLGHIADQQPVLVHKQQSTAPCIPAQRLPGVLKRKLQRQAVLYKALLEHGQKSFKRRVVPLQKIAEVARKYHDKPNFSHAALSKWASMDAVWNAFKEHTSWYNSEIVEAVITIWGDDSDKKSLKEFQEDRKNFAHFVCEDGKEAKMVLKLDEDFKQFTEEKLEQVCLTLCDLLNTTTCPLDVQEGCVKITMSIAAEVAEDVFPLSPAMKKAFQKAFPTLISISCGRTTEIFEVGTASYSVVVL